MCLPQLGHFAAGVKIAGSISFTPAVCLGGVEKKLPRVVGM